MFMCVFLFALWLILNGRITVEICLIGLAITAGVYAFCVWALGYSPKHEKGLLKRLWRYGVYFAALLWEILKANVTVMKIILTGKEYHPGIVEIKVPLKHNISRVLLSNSITLTPGTVTVTQEGESFRVLCLNEADADDILTWKLTKMLEKMEEDEAWN